MAKITKIEKNTSILKPKLRVAAYARVSMDTDRLQHSLSTQISYYSKLIQSNPDWEYVGVYTDLGITGTKIGKRSGFKQMITDCELGKIDIILTKSIQRFARNTVDLLKVIRHLKQLGIEVQFEKENIRSLSGDGELMLSILASFAQEESRSISENVKWSIRKRFESGVPHCRFHIYGYRWEDDKLVVEPNEARVVRLLYENYLKGKSPEVTKKQLDEKGIKSLRGVEFNGESLRRILKNITYTGNLLLQKEYISDPISGKLKPNCGELPQYFVENHHEAIIPMSMWEEVQEEIARRRELGVLANPAVNTSALTTKIRCECCNRSFQRAGARTVDGRIYGWKCATRKEAKKPSCKTCFIREDLLFAKFEEILKCPIDQDAIQKNILSIHVSDGNKLKINLANGQVHEWRYVSNKRNESWTAERRKQKSISMRNKHQHRYKNRATPFTGLLKCGCCSNNYKACKQKLIDGTKRCFLNCGSNRSICTNSCSIEENHLKEIICTALELEQFDEETMDSVIEKLTIKDYCLSIFFKDGTEKNIKYPKNKRISRPWTPERHALMREKIKQNWAMRKAQQNDIVEERGGEVD